MREELLDFCKPHKDKLAALTHVYYLSVKMPIEYIIGINRLSVQDIFEEKNAEIRGALVRIYGIKEFIRDGGGKSILSPEDRNGLKDGDYKWAELFELNFDDVKSYWLKLINRTIHEGAENMNAEERVKAGLGECGGKITVLRLPHGDFKNLYDAVGWTFRMPEGHYRPVIES